MSYAWRLFLCVMCLFVLGAIAVAQDATAPTDTTQISITQPGMPHLVKFSGRLAQNHGVASVILALYTEQQGGAPLWAEAQNVQLDQQGRFTINLGAASTNGLPPELFATGEARWIGVRTADGVEQPRVLLVSVPYAMKAREADTLNGLTAAQIAAQAASLIPAGTTATSDGTKPPTTSNTPGTVGATSGWTDFTDNTATYVVNVTQNGAGAGLKATTGSTTQHAIWGVNTATTGTTRGVYGEANSTTTSSAGVYGISKATTGLTYGVLGITNSTQGTALNGTATAATGQTIGLRGQANSISGIGLQGASSAATGNTTGIDGFVMSAAGTAARFDNRAGGKILSLRNAGVEKLSVDGSGNLMALGNLSAPKFIGNGSQLTNLNPATLTAGTAAIDISGHAATATAATTASALTATTQCASGFATGISTSGTAQCATNGAALTGLTLSGTYSSAVTFNNSGNSFQGSYFYGSGSTLEGMVGNSTGADGIRGTSSGVNKSGVYGVGVASGVFGVTGQSIDKAGVNGRSTSGPGVLATSTNDAGVLASSLAFDAVRGHTAGAGRSGVYGYGDASGVFGVTGRSTDTAGVYGISTSGDGMFGTSTSGYGVHGLRGAYEGFLGFSDGGVLGRNNTNGYYGYLGMSNYAGLFNGPVQVNGPLQAGSGLLLDSSVGHLAVDTLNLNSGTGVGGNGVHSNAVVFGGITSGEGIASQRTCDPQGDFQQCTGNRYGLDFYTMFAPRMSITQGGNVTIGPATGTTPTERLIVNGNIKLGNNASEFATSSVETVNLRIVRGSVQSDCTIIHGGNTFWCEHVSTGYYIIHFNVPFAYPPTTTASAYTGGWAHVQLYGPASTEAVRFLSWDHDGNYANEDFNFIAIGPR